MFVFIIEEEIVFWNIVFIYLVMKFKRNKLRFNFYNVDMYLYYLNYYKFCKFRFLGEKNKSSF